MYLFNINILLSDFSESAKMRRSSKNKKKKDATGVCEVIGFIFFFILWDIIKQAIHGLG